MKYSYKLRQNIYYDAWNWWNACNSINHGSDWKTNVDPEIVEHIYGATKNESYKFLIPYLKEKYKREKDTIKAFNNLFHKEFDQYFQVGCQKIVEVMGRPLYRNDFTIYWTTFRRGPYNKENGALWVCIYWTDQIAGFLHELCHFQFIHYWREDPSNEVSNLSEAQFEFLKESLTIILDEKFFPIINEVDKGYELHTTLRRELKDFWEKNNNFDELVDFGVTRVKTFV